MNSADHAFAQRRLAQALRQYDNAIQWWAGRKIGSSESLKAADALSDAEVELVEAARQSVATSEVDGAETSPLMGEGHAK